MVAPAMEHNLRRAAIATFLLGLLSSSASVRAEEALSLEGKIALPGVVGRIDHMAVDLARKRLLVAALGNGSLEIVDLAGTHRVKQIAGLHEPQGIAYAQKPDLVAVASAGDGTVRFYRGEDLAPAGSLALGSDADNVRIDPRTGNVIVGYGSGGLAIIDPEKRSKIGNIKLAAHPESFQLDATTGRVFVNVPDAGQIAVVDLAAAKQIARWTVPGLSANFPLALDGSGTTVAAVFRHPAKLVLLNPETGAATQQLDTCGDADDVFFDTKRRRIYVSCGAGAVDVFQDDAAGYHPVARVETSSGARTSLFVPELDRLYIAARAGLLGSDAAILVFRP
jgi:DNA-binding beta-propeller fold protein YncE